MFKKIINFAIKDSRLLSTNAVKVKICEQSKANAWQIHSYGDIKELQHGPIRIPKIQQPDDVLINVEAASVNPIDNLMLGNYCFTETIKSINSKLIQVVMAGLYSKSPESSKWNCP